MIESIDLEIIAPAFVAGLLVLMSHVLLGNEVLKRGIIFIDLAVAQIAGLGVVFAGFMGYQTSGWQVQLAAVSSALLGSWWLSYLEKKHGDIHEALIGVTFVLAATASLLLLANNPHGGEQLKDLLVGQILWVTWSQLIPISVVTVLLLVLWPKCKQAGQIGFYILFALAITSSVQLVGIYLVFASLIIPALGAKDKAKPILTAYLIGVLGYGLGLMASSVLDLPSGAVIVWSISIVALLFRIKNNHN